MADDGFHEIQLGKKQLVFLFMAAAVFSVVVFLIGVWVGRDVRRTDTEIAADVPTADVSPDTPQPPTQVAPNELDYTARLQTDSAKAGQPKAEEAAKPIEPPTPVESGPPEPVPAAKAAAPAAKTPAAKTPPQTAAATADANPAPASGGVLLQVGAFGAQGPADTLANRLKKKGYAAFVFTAPSGRTPFRVRVGPFADRAEAARVSARLKKEEGLSPLVTR